MHGKQLFRPSHLKGLAVKEWAAFIPQPHTNQVARGFHGLTVKIWFAVVHTFAVVKNEHLPALEHVLGGQISITDHGIDGLQCVATEVVEFLSDSRISAWNFIRGNAA